MAIQKLWVDKYRPQKISDYVFADNQVRSHIERWVKDKSIPNILFVGSPGTGKSSAANVLVNELEVHDYDLLKLNASATNSINDVRNKITSFIQLMPFGDYKVVLLEEFDGFSKEAMCSLRAVMEDYSNHARFILTANNGHKIHKAIHSRCQTITIEKIDIVEYTTKVATILMDENIEFDLEVLDSFVSSSYPDLRKCINLVQQYSSTGVLTLPETKSSSGGAEWKVAMVELFKTGKIREARELLCGKITVDEMESVYRWLYENVSLFGDDSKQDKVILAIKDAIVDHTIVADSEINLCACLIKIGRIYNS
jgi:replication factor C small subunit